MFKGGFPPIQYNELIINKPTTTKIVEPLSVEKILDNSKKHITVETRKLQYIEILK